VQGILLTIHLEKAESIIWPTLIVGPVPVTLSPCSPSPLGLSLSAEHPFNMDPTSLVLIAFDLFDIRQDKEEAFEYLLRAWYQAHLPAAAIRLVTHYVPLHLLTSDDPENVGEPPERGTAAYHMQSLGGSPGLAQLYMEAGLLQLEGAASVLLSSTYSPLSSIRLPPQPQHSTECMEGGTEAWKRDRQAARRYFERARALCPSLDIPLLPPEGEDSLQDSLEEIELKMPSMEVHASEGRSSSPQPLRRRRQGEEVEVVGKPETKTTDDIDNTWYLYIPGLVGAGTALLVVGVVGALSLSSWRKSQS